VQFFTVVPSTLITILGQDSNINTNTNDDNGCNKTELLSLVHDKGEGAPTPVILPSAVVQPPSPSLHDTTVKNDDPHDAILSTLLLVQHLAFGNDHNRNNHNHNTIDIPRTLLLSGPPGVGKTFSVKRAIESFDKQSQGQHHHHNGGSSSSAMIATTRIRLISLRGSELLGQSGGVLGALGGLEREFVQAATFPRPRRPLVSKGDNNNGPLVRQSSPPPPPQELSLVFLDEFDALASSSVLMQGKLADLLDRVNCNDATITGTTGMHNIMDDPCSHSTNEIVDFRRVILIAATNRVDSLPSYLRRPGRFDRELVVSPPNADQRLQILQTMIRDKEKETQTQSNKHTNTTTTVVTLAEGDNTTIMDDGSLRQVAEAAVGYVAADLAALVRRAALIHEKEKQYRNTASESNTDPSYTSAGGESSSTVAQRLTLAMKDVGASVSILM
jgi:DNA polymerase III delta prime subunit